MNAWVCLADTTATKEETGPKRFLNPAQDEQVLILCGALAAESDCKLQDRLSWLKNTGQKQHFFRWVGLLNILRHYFHLRRASVIRCGSPHYFWWLILLNRLGLFPVRNQLVFNYYFRTDSFLKRAKWWNSAPENFRVFFVSRDQIDQLEARGIRRSGIGYVPYRVDTTWFSAGAKRRGGYLLVPGNIHRDEEFVLRLAAMTPLPIIRVGQMGRLKELYRSRPVELRFNLSHSEYRDLLQNATAVLLPIEECDEPAGLTAALEALACETPVIINSSLEAEPLLRKAVGLQPIPTSDPAAWVSAIRGVLDGSLYSKAVRHGGREFVIANHSIGALTCTMAHILESIASQTKPT